jgi:sodium/hydrogen antiporter
LVDDKQVRFTIGREGRRMNKDDFLREVQNLDPKARREAIETATIPEAVKKKELRKAAAQAPAAAPVPEIWEHRASDDVEEREPAKPVAPVMAQPAAVARVSRAEEGDNETPAERRRREAALGSSGANDDDSDDEGGERVPPSRRGIRFADNVGQRRE